MRKCYNYYRNLWENNQLPEGIKKQETVFANDKIDFETIEVFGFDYDYTLVHYNKNLEKLIFDLGKEELVNIYQYPQEVNHLEYEEEFVVRGLHYDVDNGILLKLDEFNQVHSRYCYKGTKALSTEDI